VVARAQLVPRLKKCTSVQSHIAKSAASNQRCSHSAVATAASRALDCVEHGACPVLEEVGNVADSIAMGHEVPSTRAVSGVVQPGAEDQVGGDSEESAALKY
jgi:hypothetical protein